jgi:hypothetical protein
VLLHGTLIPLNAWRLWHALPACSQVRPLLKQR